MSAGPNAIPLSKENPEWLKRTNSFICNNCGYKGIVYELLCEEDDDTLWCPQCRLADWGWD